jgi:hypothetical protein
MASDVNLASELDLPNDQPDAASGSKSASNADNSPDAALEQLSEPMLEFIGHEVAEKMANFSENGDLLSWWFSCRA